MPQKCSVHLYEREATFYLEKIKKFNLVLQKKVIVSSSENVYSYFFYLVKKKSLYHAYALDISKTHSIKNKRRLFLYRHFAPEKDPIQAIVSFRELGSQEFFNEHTRSGLTVRHTKYTSYSGKDVI
jgi:hypothetical protein